jgi:Flp pilus assembly protein TadD
MSLFGKKDGDQDGGMSSGTVDIGNNLSGPGLAAPGRTIGVAPKKNNAMLLVLVGLLALGGAGGGYFYFMSAEEEIPPALQAAMAANAQRQAMGGAARVPRVPGSGRPQRPVPGVATPDIIPDAAPASPPVAAGANAGAVLPPTDGSTLPVVQQAAPPPATELVQPGTAAASPPAAAPTNITEPAVVAAAPPVLPTPVTPPLAATPVTPPAPAPNAGAATATAAAPSALASGAAPAELAIVQNAAVLNSMGAPVAASGTIAADGTGPRVADILATQQADIRPLPERYLIVHKDKDANDKDSRLTAARMALSQGRYQASLELFSELYEEDGSDKRVLMGRAVSFQKLGQTSEALEAYEEALDRDPKNLQALTNMLGLLKNEDPDAAVEKLEQLRDVYPSNADITAQLGMVHGVIGDYENALKYLEMADALKPGNPNILFNRAVVYDRMGRPAEAADLYRQLVFMAGDGSLDENFPIETVKKRLATIR